MKDVLNELSNEEGLNVLDFNTYNLLEKHGVLSGENSCAKFASRIMDFMEMLDENGIDHGLFIIHMNENCPIHKDLMAMGANDASKLADWFLPKWADWEFVLNYGYFPDDSPTDAGISALNLCSILCVKSGKLFKDQSNRVLYSATIQHEMKHYFDGRMELNMNGENNRALTGEINRLMRNIGEMDKDDSLKKLVDYFSYFFYCTSNDEISAWLEQSRLFGMLTKTARDTHTPYVKKSQSLIFSAYKDVCELILQWKDDDSKREKLDKRIELGDIKTYDEFKKFMMKTFGRYLELRFKKEATFEKYIKGYVKILDKQIKKHRKIWADGFQGNDLNLDDSEYEDILIRKRDERLARIKKKKENKNGK